MKNTCKIIVLLLAVGSLSAGPLEPETKFQPFGGFFNVINDFKKSVDTARNALDWAASNVNASVADVLAQVQMLSNCSILSMSCSANKTLCALKMALAFPAQTLANVSNAFTGTCPKAGMKNIISSINLLVDVVKMIACNATTMGAQVCPNLAKNITELENQLENIVQNLTSSVMDGAGKFFKKPKGLSPDFLNCTVSSIICLAGKSACLLKQLAQNITANMTQSPLNPFINDALMAPRENLMTVLGNLGNATEKIACKISKNITDSVNGLLSPLSMLGPMIENGLRKLSQNAQTQVNNTLLQLNICPKLVATINAAISNLTMTGQQPSCNISEKIANLSMEIQSEVQCGLKKFGMLVQNVTGTVICGLKNGTCEKKASCAKTAMNTLLTAAMGATKAVPCCVNKTLTELGNMGKEAFSQLNMTVSGIVGMVQNCTTLTTEMDIMQCLRNIVQVTVPEIMNKVIQMKQQMGASGSMSVFANCKEEAMNATMSSVMSISGNFTTCIAA